MTDYWQVRYEIVIALGHTITVEEIDGILRHVVERASDGLCWSGGVEAARGIDAVLRLAVALFPDWTSDLEAAYCDLLAPMNARGKTEPDRPCYMLGHDGRPFVTKLYFGYELYEHYSIAEQHYGDTPAMAICEAFLMWYKSKEQANNDEN